MLNRQSEQILQLYPCHFCKGSGHITTRNIFFLPCSEIFLEKWLWKFILIWQTWNGNGGVDLLPRQLGWTAEGERRVSLQYLIFRHHLDCCVEELSIILFFHNLAFGWKVIVGLSVLQHGKEFRDCESTRGSEQSLMNCCCSEPS